MPFCLVSSTMARYLFLALALLAILATSLPAADDLPAARKLLLRGKYEEAADAYRALAKKEPVEAALGLARARQAAGDREGAEKAIREALAKHADSAVLHAELALQLFERGLLDDAEKSAAQA